MAFVHLHNHTEYSLLDGQTHINDMVRRAADLGMPAVAITDHGVMSGVPELCKACKDLKEDTGQIVKPIYGCEIYLCDNEDLPKDHSSHLYHMILLAKNNVGYHNLLKLVSISHVENYYYKPRTTLSMLQKYGEGLIGTSACIAGIIPQCLDNGQKDKAIDWANKLKDCFAPGDFYIELQDQGITSYKGTTQYHLNCLLCEVAKACGLKTTAANDFHYLLREDAKTQDVMLCIGTNSKVTDVDRMRFASEEYYMKTEEEMREALADFQDACDNTVEIAEKCNVELETESILPNFPLPEGETEVSYFRRKCEEGLRNRYGDPVPKEAWDRYEYEAGIIIQQGFPAYFLIVQEYIAWARDNGIGVGPGRGSAAGAIVAYAMGITDLDPLENGLMFERFLSPERKEMPDIDVDFDDERREEVVEHVREVYGDDHVAKVITFGKMKAKNAIRDAARVLDYPYKDGDDICRLISNDPGTTIDSSLEDNVDLAKKYKEEENTKKIIDAARALEGRIRNEGVHACATIICRDPMSDHVPLKRAVGKSDDVITQYDGDYTPGLGLLKMDFLGLRTLGVLTRSCRNVKQRYNLDIVPEDIPIDDEGAFKLIQSGNTDGLFQVESALYKKLFAQIPPKRFSDIVVAIALNRTGPLESGMVDDYVKVVQGKVAPNYYDNRLKPVLEETYGSIVYQEQIMQISMVMCGFSAGKADKLRKAIGKKKIDIMRTLKEDWCKGAVENNYPLDLANQIWDDVEKFAKYAFNKSHSAAYAILVMRTAYMKAHYPQEYMAAVLTSYMSKNDRLIKYVESCKFHGLSVLPPDVNISNVDFTPVDEGVRFGLVGLRGVGSDIAKAIVEEREKNGSYKHLHDFVIRLKNYKCNRRVLEALIKAGAFDTTGYTRKQMMYFVDETPLLENASKKAKDAESGQTTLFDLAFDSDDGNDFGLEEEVPKPDGIEWSDLEIAHSEKEIMNMYLTVEPVRPYMSQISQNCMYNISQLNELDHSISKGTFGGMISNVNSNKFTRRGSRMSTFTIEDVTGQVEAICFDHDKFKDLIIDDNIVLLKGKFDKSDRGAQIIVNQVIQLTLDKNVAKMQGNNKINASTPHIQNINPPNAEVKQEHSVNNAPNAEFTQEHSVNNDPTTDVAQEPSTHEYFNIYFNDDNANPACIEAMNKVLLSHPGDSKVKIHIRQKSGKTMHADMPFSVDYNNEDLKKELLFAFDNLVKFD